MRKPISVIVLLGILTSPALAGDMALTPTGGGGPGFWPTETREDELWYQGTSFEGGFSSQIDLNDVVHAECVDDVLFPQEVIITALDWWGARAIEDLVYDSFVITFYALSGDCEAPDETVVFAERLVTDYNETDIGMGWYYLYSGVIEPLTIPAGQALWMSIRAVFPVDESDIYSGWWWTLADEQLECPALCKSVYWDIPDWIALHDYDPEYPGADAFAFRLYGELSTATEEGSWSRVKALY